jgi:hypothetical protein
MKKVMYILLYILIFFLNFEPLSPDYNQEDGSGGHSMTTIVIVTFGIIGLVGSVTGKIVLKPQKYFYALFGMCFYILLSKLSYSVSYQSFVFAVKNLSYILFFLFSAWLYSKSDKKVFNIMLFYAICNVAIAIMINCGYLDDYINYRNQGRLTLNNETANYLGDRMGISIMLLLTLCLYPHYSNIKKIFCSVMIIPCVIILIATASRGAIFLLFFLILFFIYFSKIKLVNKFFFSLSILVFIYAFWATQISKSDNIMLERLEKSVKTGDTSSRGEILIYGFNSALKRPMFGAADFHTYISKSPQAVLVHNYPIHILAMHGFYAFIFLLCFYLAAANDLRKGFKYSIYPSGVFIYILFVSFKHTEFFQIQMWFVFAIAIGLNRISRAYPTHDNKVALLKNDE